MINQLVQRLHNGDEEAFSTLYNLYWEKVYKFAQLYLNSADDIEDVVQEVFLKLWKNRTDIDEKQPFDGYIFIITRNLIFDQSRKKLNYSFLRLTVLQSLENEGEEDLSFEIADLKRHILSLVRQLPEKQQEIFKLSREQHLTNKQIAEKLSISEKAVEYHMKNILKHLRRNLFILSIFLSL